MLYQRKLILCQKLFLAFFFISLSALCYGGEDNSFDLSKISQIFTGQKSHTSQFKNYNMVDEDAYLASPNFDTHWQFGTASRKGEFNWNIASDATGKVTPNVLSELSYKDLIITEVTSAFRARKTTGALSGLLIEAKLNLGQVSTGVVQDSDYNANDRQDEYNRSVANPQGSSTVSATTAIGYNLYNSTHLAWNTWLGYAFNEQNFIKRDGKQVLSNEHPNDLAAYTNLDSQYDAQWQGPWVGGEWNWQQHNHTLGFRMEQHWPSYYAAANWNLRAELAHPKSFDQTAQGNGKVFELSYQYAITRQLHLMLQAHHEVWKTNRGIDTLYYANGNSATTRLNGANWASQGVSVGLTFQ